MMKHRAQSLEKAVAVLAILLLAGCVTPAQTVLVPNPSFESGQEAPMNWTLSGGQGAWIGDAPEGKHAVAVTGGGEDTNHWRSEELPLEPSTVYRLRFHARRIEGGGGCPTTGPVFCNRDLAGLTDLWSLYTSVFVTPRDLGQMWLRFGQWHVEGTVAYDGIELALAQPVYHTFQGLVLGEGEGISGNNYTFTAPLNTRSFNHARPLAYHRRQFNTHRWAFGADSEVVYRHRVGAFEQTAGQVEVTVGHYTSGQLCVEAGADGSAWEEIGRLDGLGTGTFDIPEDLLPATEVWIRLRSRTPEEPGQDVDPGSFQVYTYTYRASLDGTPGDYRGKTRFVAVPKSDPRVKVAVDTFGEGIPGGRNVLIARVENTSDDTIPARPSITLTPAGGKPARTAVDVDLVPGVQEIRIPYKVSGTGTVDAVVTLGKQIGFRAETSFDVSPLYETAYGEVLPGSTGRVGLWWASSGWKISRTRPLPTQAGAAIRIQAAKNEAEAAQLVLRPDSAMRAFIAEAKPLTGPKGATIPADRIDVLRVGYVPVTLPTDKVGAVAPWPDPLPPFQGPIDLDAQKNQPLWVRVRVPKDTPAGVYKGAIGLTAKDYAAEVPLEVTVFDFTLPDRMTCTTAFGMSPGNVFRYHNLTDPDDKRAVFDKYLANYSAHHISPYNPAPLDAVNVTWPERQSEDGAFDPADFTPQMDWTAWDAAMERAIDHYHFNSFRFSIPGLGGGTFHSRSEPSLLGFSEDTPQYKAAFAAYCRLAEDHLREKGWLDEAYVYWFDEPDPKDYAFVMNGFRKLEEAAPGIGRMLTEQVEPKLVGGPNIWCPLTPAFDLDEAQERRAQGDRFWWYICTGPKAPYATLFIDHPGTELRVWLWQTWKRRISGTLIWQTNYWTSGPAYPDPDRPQNPYEDPMGWTSGYSTPDGAKRPWGNGDGRFVYPPEAAADAHPDAPVLDGPVDSLRWEMLRDGIEDYEYMAMLERLVEEHRDRLPERIRRAYEALLEVPDTITTDLTHFTVNPGPIEQHRQAVARVLEKLCKL